MRHVQFLCQQFFADVVAAEKHCNPDIVKTVHGFLVHCLLLVPNKIYLRISNVLENVFNKTYLRISDVYEVYKVLALFGLLCWISIFTIFCENRKKSA